MAFLIFATQLQIFADKRPAGLPQKKEVWPRIGFASTLHQRRFALRERPFRERPPNSEIDRSIALSLAGIHPERNVGMG